MKWNQSNWDQFKENVNSPAILKMLDEFMSTDFSLDINGINLATKKLKLHIQNIDNST